MSAVRFDFRIEKASPTGRYVSGWLSVVEKDGKPVEDSQGDIVAMEEVRKAFHKYMRGSRVIKSQHAGDGIGDLVECVIVDDDFAKAHGVTHSQRGVWGTAEITDEKEQARVRKGEYGGFSIGGRGKRTEIKKASPGASDVHVDGVMSTKKPIGRSRVRFTLSKRARLARRALQR